MAVAGLALAGVVLTDVPLATAQEAPRPVVVGALDGPGQVVLRAGGSPPIVLGAEVVDDAAVTSVEIVVSDSQGAVVRSAAATLTSGTQARGHWRAAGFTLPVSAPTGRWSVSARLCDETTCVLAPVGGFGVVRHTYVAGESARPARVVEGLPVTVRGRLMRLAANGTYSGYFDAFVRLEHRATGAETFARVRTVQLTGTGRTASRVRARDSGQWRLRYVGSATYAASTGEVSSVDVSAASTRVFGRSVRGRPLTLHRIGDPEAKRRVVVVGSIHGNEAAGRAVVARLRRTAPPRGVVHYLVPDLNPDGTRAGTRQNARGVDLNRNFPRRWTHRGARWSTYFAGRRPLSEPESRAARRLIRSVRPTTTIWYHQRMNLVDPSAGPLRVAKAYAREARQRVAPLPRYGGSVATWQRAHWRLRAVLVVELSSRLTESGARRHARAVVRAAKV